MSRNPEFRRNLVLELTRSRLVMMPCVLILAMLLAYVLVPEPVKLRAAGWTAFGLFTAVTLFWGTQLATASMFDEFRDKTWDQQRLSAIDPWTLTWGKLFGGTVFAWYGAVICLPVFIAGTLGDFVGPPTIPLVVLALGAALLMHSLGLLSALLAPRNSAGRSSFAVITLLILLLSVWPLISNLAESKPAEWWGFQLNALWFCAASCWAFAAWGVTGVYRTLCAELQVRTTPVAWVALAAFLSLYLTGLAVGQFNNASAVTVFAVIGFCVTLVMTYLSAWIEKRDIISVRRLVLRYKAGNRRRTAEEMPCWLATAPFALLFALYLLVRGEGTAVATLADHAVPALPLGFMMMALRDIALLYFFSFAANRRNVEVAVIMYLGLLYWLVPALLSAVGLKPVAILILPPFTTNPLLALAIATLQAALAIGLAVTRWNKRRAATEAPAAA